MAEPQARAGPRGRGAGRGGRGGFSSRGGRPRPANKEADPTPSYEGEGEIGDLKRQYRAELNTIREMFPDWTDEDLVFALQETDGDLEATIERISEGNVAQWGEVKKKTKERAPKKGKDDHEGADGKAAGRGHGRASDAPRGRARGGERGRSGRGRGGAVVNGAKKSNVAEKGDGAGEGNVSWDAPPAKTRDDGKGGSVSPDAASWEVINSSEALPPAAEPAKGPKPEPARTWASLMKPAPKPKAPLAKPKAAPIPPADPVAKDAAMAPIAVDAETDKAPPAPEEPVVPARSPSIPASDPPVDITPSKDELTKTNLEQVQDVSQPVASETVASNAGTNDPQMSGTPLAGASQPSSNRPSLGGFATTAQKAAGGSARASSYQRRVKDQQEAVVMPGNHAVDRAAVQFGSLGLSTEDVDDEREEAETRQQPPQHSPVAPRASLPPAQQTISADSAVTSRPPGLPAISPAPADPASQAAGNNYGYNQFNNLYGTAGQTDAAAAAHSKQFDPPGQGQPALSQGFDNYPAHSQAAGQQAHAHAQAAYSSAGSEYPSYYSSDNQRAYQNYYGYGHQVQPQAHESAAAAAQQKMGTGFGAGANGDQASAGAAGPAQSNAPNRFGAPNEGQPSGHSTPNPPTGPSQGPQSHQVGQGHGPASGHGFPYGGNPYYNHHSYYPSSYMNQFGYGGRHGGYNAPYGNKYGQPHSYGMSSQSPFDPHSASPANAGHYGQPHNIPGRDNASFGSYGRAGSTQPSESTQSHGNSAFAGMSDVFNRTQSGYSTGQTSQQAGSQQGGPNADDAARSGYTDTSKVAGGPSPAPGPAARPGSAANLGGQSIPSTQGQGYSGYPSQMGMHGQQSQYGSSLGGLGGHQGQSHQNSGYGGYGSGFGGNYYNSNSRGGWGGNYGH